MYFKKSRFLSTTPIPAETATKWVSDGQAGLRKRMTFKFAGHANRNTFSARDADEGRQYRLLFASA